MPPSSVLYAVFLGIGIAGARKVSGGDWKDLLVAGRAMPLWLAVLTMTATWVDGGYLLGTAEGTFKSGIPLGVQGGLCFGISLILGGLFFARRMRRLEFTTLIDPFEARFGGRWAAVLFVPALLGEVFWSAELLVAIGSTFGVMLGMPLTTAILLSALVVTAYTVLGGMWSVAYTDAFQLGLVALGLLAALAVRLAAAGGLRRAWAAYAAARPDGARPAAAAATGGAAAGPAASIVSWWDVSLMLMLGGIPWNCYFQRVLSCQTPAQGAVALDPRRPAHDRASPCRRCCSASRRSPTRGRPTSCAQLHAQPAQALPMMFQHLRARLGRLLGLGAIIGAVTSSFSASILSAGSMLAWNCVYRLCAARPRPAAADAADSPGDRRCSAPRPPSWRSRCRACRRCGSSRATWSSSCCSRSWSFALFDPKANRIGSIAAFVVSLVLRLGGGEPLFGIPPSIPYPELFAGVLPGTPGSWYDAGGALLFPYKTLAALAGLVIAAGRVAADRALGPAACAAEHARRARRDANANRVRNAERTRSLHVRLMGANAELFAWLAHAYTALGLVCAAAIFVADRPRRRRRVPPGVPADDRGDRDRRDRRLAGPPRAGEATCCPGSTAAGSTT